MRRLQSDLLRVWSVLVATLTEHIPPDHAPRLILAHELLRLGTPVLLRITGLALIPLPPAKRVGTVTNRENSVGARLNIKALDRRRLCGVRLLR